MYTYMIICHITQSVSRGMRTKFIFHIFWTSWVMTEVFLFYLTNLELSLFRPQKAWEEIASDLYACGCIGASHPGGMWRLKSCFWQEKGFTQ